MQTRKRKSLTTQVIILTLMTVILSCGAICLLSYRLAKNMAVNNVAHEAMSISQTVAASIKSDGFTQIVTSGVKDDYYRQIEKALNTTLTNTDALFLYVLLSEYSDSEVTYFTEGSVDGYDTYELGVKESTEYYPQAMFDSIDNAVPTQSEVFYSDLYGASVGGYAPILDTGGGVIGVVGTEYKLASVMAPFNTFVTTLVTTVAIFSVVLSIFLAFLVVNKLVRPLKKLAEAAELVSDGNFDISLPKSESNEIGALSDSFMRLTESINGLTNEINAVATAQSEGSLDRLLDEELYKGKYRDIAQIINKMIMEQNEITDLAIDCVYEIGNGNFNAEVRQFPGDKAVLNKTIDLLRKNLFDVHEEISKLAKQAANGNLSVRVDSDYFTGDWAGLMNQLNTLVSSVASPMGETIEVLEKVAEGNFSALMQGDYKGSFLKIKTSVNTMLTNTAGYISEISAVLSALSSGDYTAYIEGDYVGEFQSLKDSINNIVDNLNSVLSEIKSSVKELNAGSKRISESSKTLANGAMEQASIAENLNKIMDDFEEIIEENSGSANSASGISANVNSVAAVGNNEMNELLAAIEEIKTASGSISSILKVIENIALQTNLLSLNAAVEAARAGEHGKSFAVVADEVRALADRSGKAAEESRKFITSTEEKVELGVRIAHNTFETLKKITVLIDTVLASVAGIADLSQKQSEKMREALADVERISQVAQIDANISREFSTTATELSSQANRFYETLKKFKLK